MLVRLCLHVISWFVNSKNLMQIFTDYDKVNEGVSGVKNSLKSPYWPHESGILICSLLLKCKSCIS